MASSGSKKPGNPMVMLCGIFVAVWLLVLAGTIIIFEVIVPLQLFHGFLNGVTKGVLATVLVIVWVGLFVLLRDEMVKRQLPLEKDVSIA